MFKHILIPTDGSAIANKAAKAGIRLAKALAARVTGYYAIEAVGPQVYAEGFIPDPVLTAEWDRRAQEYGEKQLAAMAKLARAAGVRFRPLCARATTPAEGIIQTARRQKCDLIFMASHGRSGLVKLVMGSVTEKVLKTSKTPVLVFR
jgi:nucleotide-binding universal stress UspA family protein